MSPTLKKVLMIGGAAVVGYVVYKKVKGASTAAIGAARVAQLKSTAKIAQMTKLNGSDILEELGLEEALGSLGGKRR